MSARAFTGPGNQTSGISNSGTGAPVVLAKPANLADRDHMVAVLYMRGDSVAAPPPAGWQLISDTPTHALGSMAVYAKYVPNAAAETATSYSFVPSQGGRKAGLLFRVTGGHPTDLKGEVGTIATSVNLNANLRLDGVQPAAPYSLMLNIIGLNAPLPLPSMVDTAEMALAPPVATSTGATETILYVAHQQLSSTDFVQRNDWTTTPYPPSGFGYVLTLRSGGNAPEVGVQTRFTADPAETTKVSAFVKFGVVTSWEWRQTGGPAAQFTANGKTLSFTAPSLMNTTDVTFEVRGLENGVPSPWVPVVVTVRPHQSWHLTTGGWVPTKAPRTWKKADVSGRWVRPGMEYVKPGIPVSELLAKPTFFIAHRGSGDEFPEHTMEAYQGATFGGADAIEVSVQRTLDGVMVCHHDADLKRTTNSTGLIADRTYQDLYDNVRVVQDSIIGPAQEGVRLPLATDVIARFIGKKVIFLEGKASSAHLPLFALLDQYAADGINLAEWVVQKQHYKGGTVTKQMAHDRGMKVWGYVDEGTTDAEMDAEDHRVDLWGVPDFMPLARKQQIVNRPGGKVVICWQVHRRSQVAEHQSIGLAGQMSAGLLYVHENAQRQKRDSFATRRKAPGDMWSANISVSNLAMTFDAQGRGHHKFPDPICTTVMGSMCPTGPAFTLKATMEYDTAPTFGWSGIAFSCPNDEIFRPVNGTIDPAWSSWVNKTGGYFLELGRTGTVRLLRYGVGAWAPVELATATIPGFVAGSAVNVQLAVNAAGIAATVNGTSLTSNDTTYRGEYFHLCQGTSLSLAKFSNVEVI